MESSETMQRPRVEFSVTASFLPANRTELENRGRLRLGDHPARTSYQFVSLTWYKSSRAFQI
jgi:hypothetical protein